MNLFGRHFSGLLDFSGRENRQPFWLWVLVVYVFQLIVSLIIMIPLMMAGFSQMQSMMGNDPTYTREHPEIMQQVMMHAVAPMMRGVMLTSAILSLLFVLLMAAATVRRLHDGDRSGWWCSPYFALQIITPIAYAAVFPTMFDKIGVVRPGATPDEVQAAMGPMMQTMMGIQLIGMISFLIMIVLVVFLCLPGTPGPNRFGDDPLRPPFDPPRPRFP